MEKFHEALKKARQQTAYRSAQAFAKHADLRPRTYQSYESGERVPPDPVLEAIINKTRLSPMEAERLRSMHRLALAEKPDVDMSQFSHLVDVSELSEKITREVKYELQRYNVTVTPRMERVVERRVSMVLDNALRRK